MAGPVEGVSASMPIEGAGGVDVVNLAQNLKHQIDTLSQNLNQLAQNPSLSADTSFQQQIAANTILLQQINEQALKLAVVKQ